MTPFFAHLGSALAFPVPKPFCLRAPPRRCFGVSSSSSPSSDPVGGEVVWAIAAAPIVDYKDRYTIYLRHEYAKYVRAARL